jgi:hypothetical protein
LAGSFTQDGINPQRISAKCRCPSMSRMIGIGCVGAML